MPTGPAPELALAARTDRPEWSARSAVGGRRPALRSLSVGLLGSVLAEAAFSPPPSAWRRSSVADADVWARSSSFAFDAAWRAPAAAPLPAMPLPPALSAARATPGAVLSTSDSLATRRSAHVSPKWPHSARKRHVATSWVAGDVETGGTGAPSAGCQRSCPSSAAASPAGAQSSCAEAPPRWANSPVSIETSRDNGCSRPAPGSVAALHIA
jgi:hypothetical protein